MHDQPAENCILSSRYDQASTSQYSLPPGKAGGDFPSDPSTALAGAQKTPN